jgi:methionyl-tRNA synthetase
MEIIVNQHNSFYITTPIYYVNAEPHIGNAYTTVAADVLNRYNRLFGLESYFLTGTDEHGSKVAESAEKMGIEPQKFCDINSQKFKDSWKILNVEYDQFIRTTDPEHEAIVRKFIQTLYDKGYIYQGEYIGQYCTGCEKFLTDKDLNEEGQCSIHLTKPQELKEKNYFFKLSEFIQPLKEKIESGVLQILPEMRKKEVLGLIKQDLDDFSLSREKVNWGIDIPFDETQVTYVWIDALTNYISACGYPDSPNFDKLWNNSTIIHLLAKDIIKFHCIFWPALLMAAEIKLPEKIIVHGYLILDSQKISKSLGNIIKPDDMIGWFGVDASRYLVLNMCAFGSDGDIRIEDFYTKYNADLANNYGNLVSRTFKMIERNLDGILPRKSWTEMPEIIKEGYAAIESVMKKLENVQIKIATEEVISYLNKLNGYFDENKPWILAKEKQTEKLSEVLYNVAYGISIATALMSPYLTEKTNTVIEALFGPDVSAKDIIKDLGQGLEFAPELKVSKDKLFPRLDMPKAPKEEPKTTEADNLISIDDVSKVQLKVAEIKEAEKVPDADKLLRLQIEIGKDKRQIVAGIAQYYEPAQLLGKKVIVVINLKPAILRGIESNGMLLAAKKKNKLTLLTIDEDLPSGAKIS